MNGVTGTTALAPLHWPGRPSDDIVATTLAVGEEDGGARPRPRPPRWGWNPIGPPRWGWNPIGPPRWGWNPPTWGWNPIGPPIWGWNPPVSPWPIYRGF